MIEFIRNILGEHAPIGYLCFGLIPDDTDPKRPVSDHHFFEWPDQTDEIVDFLARHAEEDVYFIPALFNQRQALKEFLFYRPVISVDADDASPENYSLAPSIIVETSPNRWHLYWVMKEAISPDWAERMSMMVTYSQREHGSDIGGWAKNKFLRVPGTLNMKWALKEPFKVQVSYTGIEYTKRLMEENFQSLNIDLVRGTDETFPATSELPDRVSVMLKVPASPSIDRMLNQPPGENMWSETLWRLELDLLRSGLTKPEVYVMCLGCACDKWSRDGKSPMNLWKEINRASFEIEKEALTGRTIDYKNLPVKLDNPDQVPPASIPDFITNEERERKREPNFIDKYVAWACTKTDADPVYHKTNAMMILSTILGDFGHAMPQFGKLNLNLWVMILGRTTDSRKTTARNMMLEILFSLNGEEYEYDLGSDSTSEGLLIDLAARPCRSGMHYVDEAQNLLAGTKGGKSYLSDFTATLTELYDGWVRGRRRATGTIKKTARTQTTFNLYLMGVPSKMTEVLNPDDFESGFLARFIYVLGEAVTINKETARLNQRDVNASHSDPAQMELIQYLTIMRDRWSSQVEPGETKPIFVAEDAWERFNEYIYTLIQMANEADKPELMKPSSDRMNKSVLKLACVLAMSYGRDTVSMDDMLTAIEYSETWYAHLIRMTRMIDASEWSTQIRKLVEFVASVGIVKYTVAYKRFNHLKPREFQELVQAAQETNEVQFVPARVDSPERWIRIVEPGEVL